jgi:hypothetical protein
VSKVLLKLCLVASISLAMYEGLYPSTAKSISADDYTSSVSKKVIELKFDTAKVSAYIIKLINTSDQSLYCKLEAHSMIYTLAGFEQTKATMEGIASDKSKMDAATKKIIQDAEDEGNRRMNELNLKMLEKRLRITDSACK